MFGAIPETYSNALLDVPTGKSTTPPETNTEDFAKEAASTHALLWNPAVDDAHSFEHARQPRRFVLVVTAAALVPKPHLHHHRQHHD